jgi:hypothetical protein
MAEHGRLGIVRCFEHTERISGRRAKTVLMPIWALSCVINEEGLSYYFCYYDYYICYHLYAWYLQLYTWNHVSRVFVLLFCVLGMFCATSSVLSAVCVLRCTISLFFMVPWFRDSPLYFSGILLIILTWFQLPLLLLASLFVFAFRVRSVSIIRSLYFRIF